MEEKDIELQCLECGHVYKDSELQETDGWCPHCEDTYRMTNKWKEVEEK